MNDAAASTDEGESLLSMACSAGYYELAQVRIGYNLYLTNPRQKSAKNYCIEHY